MEKLRARGAGQLVSVLIRARSKPLELAAVPLPALTMVGRTLAAGSSSPIRNTASAHSVLESEHLLLHQKMVSQPRMRHIATRMVSLAERPIVRKQIPAARAILPEPRALTMKSA